MQMRSWKYRLYPKKNQHSVLEQQLYESKNLWNKLLEYIKDYYQTNTKLPTKGQLFKLVNSYSLLCLEALNNKSLARGFLAKQVLDCSFAEFSNMLSYKAESAGCIVVFVNPAGTTSTCSHCGLREKKNLSIRQHSCICGAQMHRDHNAAINILNLGLGQRSTAGTAESHACGVGASIANATSSFIETGSSGL